MRILSGVLVALVAVTAIVSTPGTAEASTYIATDHFQRSVSNGWGTATPGGSYVVQGPSSDYWTSDVSYKRGLGYMRVPRSNTSRGAVLPRAQARNVELQFSAYITAPAGNGPYYIYAVGRSSGNNEFRARVIYNRDCTISTNGSIVQGGREQPLGPPVKVPNSNWCDGRSASRIVNLRAQIFGATSTTVRIKAWPATNPGEPANWLFSASTNASFSAPSPVVGLRAYASAGAFAPVDFVFYNWSARSL